MNVLIYIGDDLLDIIPGTTVAYTFQNTLISSIETRRSSYTNKFKLPKTENNKILLNFQDEIKVKQEYPVLRAKVVLNGFEIVSSGVMVVSVVKDYFEVFILDGIVSFIESLGDETIDDLYELDTTLHTWDASTIDTKRSSTSGICSPFINYGQLYEIQELLNKSFADSSVWEQYRRAIAEFDWSVGSGQAFVGLESYTSGDVFQDGTSVLLRQEFLFAKDISYDISVTFYYDDQGDQPELYVYAMADNGNFYGEANFGAAPNTATLDTLTITPTQNCTFIAIEGFLSAPGTNGTKVGDLYVNDIEIAIDLKIGSVYLPSVFYKSVIDTIISNAGYSASYSNTVFNNLLISWSKKELKYTGFFNECREFKAQLTTPQNLVADGNVVFDTIVKKDLFGLYDPTDGTYDQNNTYESVVSSDNRSFFSKFYAVLKVRLDSGSAVFSIKSQGEGDISTFTISTPGIYTVNLAVNKFQDSNFGYNMDGGEQVFIYCNVSGGSPDVTILSGEFYNLVDGINQEDTPRFYACEILPELKKVDLIKDFFIRFGIIPYEKNQVLTFKSFNEVINDKASALDWTSKRDKSFEDEIRYDAVYAQNNYFRYPSSDDFFIDSFVKGNIQCNNTNIEIEQDLYESKFNGSIDVSVGTDTDYVYVGYVPVWNNPPEAYPVLNEDKFDNDTGLRILISRAKESGEAAVVYNVTSRTDYRVANFTLPDSNYLSWQGFLDANYSALSNAIGQNKSLIRYYYLDDIDIKSVTPHTMIYDDGSYFLIEKIPNYVSGKITKVELYKVQ